MQVLFDIRSFTDAELKERSARAEAMRDGGHQGDREADALLFERIRRASATHHRVAYNGATKTIDYVNDKKMEFHIACMRILDNGANGFVLTPKGEVFAVKQGKRSAQRVRDAGELNNAVALFH